MKRIILMTSAAVIAVVMAAGISYGEFEDANIQTQVALEANLEARLKSVISEIIGSNKLAVVINVQLRTEKEKKSLQDLIKQKKKKSSIILPGVPAKDALDKEEMPILAPLTFSETRTSIKKIIE